MVHDSLALTEHNIDITDAMNDASLTHSGITSQ